MIATDWGDGIALDPIVMPDATPDWAAHVIERGLAHASESGFGAVDIMVDRTDDVMREVLVGHGFAIEEDGKDDVESWLAADARTEISPLHHDYRLSSRLDTMLRPHHMIQRNGPDVETRLRQTSLYRPDLDLLVFDSRDSVAAYGLFWFDPETATGLGVSTSALASDPSSRPQSSLAELAHELRRRTLRLIVGRTARQQPSERPTS